MDKKKIERINELARKAKAEGLTEAEIKERDELRREYINAFKSDLQSTLDSMYVVDEDGNKSPIKKKDEKNEKQ